MEMVLDARFAYGANRPWVYTVEGGVSMVAGPDAVALRVPVPLRREKDTIVVSFPIKKGQKIAFQLNWHPLHLSEPREL